MREFDSGATRDDSEGKLDFEGFLSPIVLEAYAQYLDKHRVQADGNLRDSDNWQGGFGPDHSAVCIKSMLRHVMDVWMWHRGYEPRETIDEAICGVIFNAMALYHQLLLGRMRDEVVNVRTDEVNWYNFRK